MDNFIRSAKEIGVAKDQLINFVHAGYIPLKWQLKFHGAARSADKEGGPVDIGVGGARGPGKSHCTFAQLALDDCQRINGLKALFLRQTGKSAEESFKDLIDSVLTGRIAYQYNGSKGILGFKNGSKVILGGFETEKDIDKYIGIQYDVIVIEERNQLTGEKILKLKGSLRTVKPNWRARMYSSFNPGNIGHADIKKTMVDPHALQREIETRFIPATYRDNPFLKKEYIDYLMGLEGALGKAWRDGNFDTFEGQYFIEWDREKHTVAPFAVPPSWKRFRSYDYGHENPATCAWYALDYDGRIWVYRELYLQKGHKQDADKQAQQIAKMSEGEQYEYSVADPAIFSPTGMVDKYGGQTIAETFARNGITFIPASNRRVDGWSLLHKYLFWNKNTDPKIKYFSTCLDSIRTIPELIHDSHRPEDVDSRGEDHAADRDRYLLLTLHETKTAKPKSDTEKKLEQLKNLKLENVNPSVLNDFYQGDFYRNSYGK